MTIKNFPRVTQHQKELLKRVMNYFHKNGNGAPFRNDYIVMRVSQVATNDYSDTIFIPNHNNEDDFEFWSPFKCNAFTNDAEKIITGSYDYRLAKRLGCVYGQQMGPVYYENTHFQIVQTDSISRHLKGINLIAHQIHSIIPVVTPVSKASSGSIKIHPSAHSLMKHNYDDSECVFKLYVIDINFLLNQL
jgi:hypothetical protein